MSTPDPYAKYGGAVAVDPYAKYGGSVGSSAPAPATKDQIDAVRQSVTAASTVKPLAPQSASEWLDSAKSLASGFVEGINPLPALHALFTHPVDTVEGMGKAQAAEYTKAQDAYKKGNYSEAIGHTVALALPLLGPAAANAGETIGSGNVAEGLGKSAAILAPFAASAAGRMVAGRTITPSLLTKNPAEAAAVRYGMDNALPVDAAAATGNPAVRGAQWLADRSIGGSVANSGQAATAGKSMAAKMGELAAGTAKNAPITPAQAGEGVQSALDAKITAHGADANAAYSKLRTIENDPKNLQTVQTGTKPAPLSLNTLGQGPRGTVPVTEQIPLPVDVRAAKAALAPVLENLKRQMPVAQQQASAGLKAIDNIVNGPDFAPASQVDAGLGAIKGIVRGAEAPNLRNVSQGLAAKAVDELGGAVDAAVAKGGPDATAALKAGRDATKAKYAVADVLKGVRDEPVQAFNQMIYSKDAGIEQLKAVAQHAPQEMPKIGSAFLGDLLDTATTNGSFDKAQGLAAKWEKLGPQTKQLLFKDPQYIGDLDKFFLLAKKLAENPNPSGTGYVTSLVAQGYAVGASPIIGGLTQLGAGIVSKMMHSPAAVKILVDGIKATGTVPRTAAGVLASMKIINSARSAAAADAESSPSTRSGPLIAQPALQ